MAVDISRGGLVALACALSLVSGLAGGLLALALDDPDVVITERVVEVAAPAGASEAPTELSPGDVEQLRLSYVAITGEDEAWTTGLVHEIGGSVCEGGQTAADLLAGPLGRDITMEQADLEDFVDEVLLACP